ncbi:MAG: shikimate dehydrogenase [Chloroflexi bacterium]|nr:shikimate dehydrogenase [Chloroflexota bacterium]MYK61852.1 shikimate dehydrogenase [Chloroflexota bacterium]
MTTSNFGIIGYPLGHTLSPVFQNAALERHGIDELFEAWPTHPDDLAAKVESFRADGFLASCVTLPHKQAVIPMIDDLADTAIAVGAVNWIINNNGHLTGHNTDSPGFLRALTELGEFDPAGKTALVFGAGGAARAIVHALKTAGVASMTIANRTVARAEELADDFSDDTLNINSCGLDADDLNDISLASDLLVNTSSMGMDGGPAPDATPVTADAISPDAVAYDAVYAPPMTPFLNEVEKAGAKSLRGFTMLLLQGAVGFELATGKPAPVDEMFEAVRRATS